MLLVRHSAPELDPSVPSQEWRLSEEGRRRCGPLAERLARYEPRVLLASSEPKARETAELVAPVLGLEMQVSDGLRETARRTVGWLAPEDLDRGIRELFERPGEVVFGEESAAAALRRFEARRTVGRLAPEDLDRRIRELVERPGEVVFGEESAAAALARFEAAVAGLPDPAVVVTHGTVLSLYAAPRIGREPYELWRSLELPDVVEVPWSS